MEKIDSCGLEWCRHDQMEERCGLCKLEREIDRLRTANENNLAGWLNEVGHLRARISRQEDALKKVREWASRHTARSTINSLKLESIVSYGLGEDNE